MPGRGYRAAGKFAVLPLRRQLPCLASLRKAVVVSAAVAAGCGPVFAGVETLRAERKLEEARALGAAEHAPYEYTMAEEHLEKARLEAAEADYGDAERLSQTALGYAERALALARAARRDTGR